MPMKLPSDRISWMAIQATVNILPHQSSKLFMRGKLRAKLMSAQHRSFKVVFKGVNRHCIDNTPGRLFHFQFQAIVIIVDNSHLETESRLHYRYTHEECLCSSSKKKKVKVWFYISLYPVRWTAQSALHFPPLADLFILTPFSASLGSILAMQQLRNDYSVTFPPLSIARYSFIQLSRLRRREVKENAQTSKR